MTSRGIEQNFIPPGTSNLVCNWQRQERTIKTALKSVLKHQFPHEEVLLSLMVEDIVYVPPLVHLSVDPDDEEAQSPNHLLIVSSSSNILLMPSVTIYVKFHYISCTGG